MRLQRRTPIQRRRAFLASLAVIAVGLCMAGAVAYACSGGVNAQTFVTPNAGTHGTQLIVQTWTGGSALDTTKTYHFRYAPPGDNITCAAKPDIGGAVTTATGYIGVPTHLSRTITNLGGNGSPGQTGEACWSSGNPVGNQIAAPAYITVN